MDDEIHAETNSLRDLVFGSVVFSVSDDRGLVGCAARVAHVTNLPAGVSEQQAKNYDVAVATCTRSADYQHRAANHLGLATRASDDAYLRLTLPVDRQN